ncbi:hypothetical protein GDO81_006469 [Engystomops pustulosus]|uniref:Uncharacterized protein n=1 Tax=Engystomops pustulosus TaxID=76066 RepID=A0AAV7CYX5_ENGPU|nr:hypothetical protein GDO81_006469 [Engystomops pustulosus]
MGSSPSKPEKPTTVSTTTIVTTTTTISPTFSSQTTLVSDRTEHCSGHVELVLAFFGGVLFALLICAIVYCVIKIKDKVKRKCGPTRLVRREQESSSGVGCHHVEITDEEVSYATLRFIKP